MTNNSNAKPYKQNFYSNEQAKLFAYSFARYVNKKKIPELFVFKVTERTGLAFSKIKKDLQER